ncbi:MAG TPA: DUF1385 domain-containing protein [Polyangiaceae bacterium]|nr:DUF1385 domain-containing protein [Polyangiaceae bacterium]
MSAAETEKPSPTNVGGQALIEGVLMRAPGSLAIACRRRDGSITLRERTMPATSGVWQKTPLLRGVNTLVSSLRIGFQAMTFAAELQAEDYEEEEDEAPASSTKGSTAAKPSAGVRSGKKSGTSVSSLTLTSLALSPLHLLLGSDGDPAEIAIEKKDPEEKAAAHDDDPPRLDAPKAEPARAAAKSSAAKKAAPAPAEEEDEEEEGGAKQLLFVIPVLFAIGLFIALPQATASGVNSLFGLGLDQFSPLFQVITGIAKLTIIVGYMSLLRLTKSGFRVFQYHGAEHKAISTYEAGQALVVENARRTTALHARCGTTFIIMVAFVSVAMFAGLGAVLRKVMPLPDAEIAKSLLLFVMKLPLLPVVAGITFELQRFFARYCSTGPLQFLLWPGFAVQKITTATPDDDQLEVALASLRSALARAPEKLPEDHPDQTFSTYDTLASDPTYALPLARQAAG